MKKIILMLLLFSLIYTSAYCDSGDDHHMDTAYIMIPVMVVMIAGYHFLFNRSTKEAKEQRKTDNQRYRKK